MTSKCGIQKVTLIDYPGLVAAILFFPGCNLRCPYCHNPSLVTPPFPKDLSTIDEAFAYLEKRKNVLGGVVLSGGEPMMNPEIPEIVDRIHALGLKVKIDTNGTFPERLKEIKPDFIAMDIKTSPGKYGLLTKDDVGLKIVESIMRIRCSGIPHIFRTVMDSGIVDDNDINFIELLADEKIKRVPVNYENVLLRDVVGGKI
jgi:pyruvate formate lyase activating enzyme